MAAQEWQSLLAWDPMSVEAVSLMAEEPGPVLVSRREAGARAVPVETVARALGYTDYQFALAGDLLNRFAWRRT
jgi:hypothetical protein